MSVSKHNVLLTGGTGFVGKALLALLVDAPHYDHIYLLARGRRGQSADERVRGILANMFPAEKAAKLAERVHGVAGDLTEARMGLNSEQLSDLATKVHQIVHIGASTDFGAPLAESRLHNVEGTRHALDVAVNLREQGVLQRFDYVSTAYVAGKKPGIVGENDLERGQEFSNSYEQSKFEAECLVRSYHDRLSIAVYRPSIVVGDSQSGYTPHFKVLYWPLQLLAKNLIPFFPCNTRARLDVVPVDYVAQGILALMQTPRSLGETFLLTAGLGHEVQIKQLLQDAYRMAGIQKRPILPFWLFALVRRSPLAKRFDDYFWQAVDMALPYYSYLKGNRVYFEDQRSRALLQELGVNQPRWPEYKQRVLGFCLESRWGRKLPKPEHTYYAIKPQWA